MPHDPAGATYALPDLQYSLKCPKSAFIDIKALPPPDQTRGQSNRDADDSGEGQGYDVWGHNVVQNMDHAERPARRERKSPKKIEGFVEIGNFCRLRISCDFEPERWWGGVACAG
jgi:hypothetical protein